MKRPNKTMQKQSAAAEKFSTAGKLNYGIATLVVVLKKHLSLTKPTLLGGPPLNEKFQGT